MIRPTHRNDAMKDQPDKAAAPSRNWARQSDGVNRMAILVTEGGEEVKGILHYLTGTIYP